MAKLVSGELEVHRTQTLFGGKIREGSSLQHRHMETFINDSYSY